MLKQRNERLEKELDMLREQVRLQEDAYNPTVPESQPKSTPHVQHLDSQTSVEESGSGLTMAYKNGLRVTSEDGQFRVRLGGRVTGRFKALDSGHPLNDEFSVERARWFTNVSLFDHYDLRVQVEFSENVKLKDGYMDIHYVPWARLRLGQFKVPFAGEYQRSHKYIDFAERSIAVDNMRFTGRDIGIMLHGRLYDEMLQYQLAVLNGTGENKGDDNDAKDFAGRIVFGPFLRTENDLLSDMHFGIAGTRGDQDTDFSNLGFKTVAGTEFVDFAPDTMHKGSRTRLGTEFMWLVGPASLKAEWMRMWLEDVQAGPSKDDLNFYSWYVSGSYLLTGEKKVLGKTIPVHSFNPSEGLWGAWELATRYSLYHSDKDLFRLGMAEGTEKAEAFTIGLNWYLNELLRVTFNYEHTEFDDALVIDGQTLNDEDAFLVQCQLEF